ncbi:MAG: YihY family inner membrane protein [Desulfobacterales bacterium]|nr:YihY family inner membrane protein [Desulfobacterales bacterium]
MTEKRAVVSRTTTFLKDGIWRVRLDDLPRRQAFWIRQLRVILLSVQGFSRDACPLRASALTFYSLLSLVPVAAMVFGVAKGFGFDRRLETEILGKFPGQEEIVVQVIAFARTFLENTKGGIIAGIGLVVLFWTVIKVLGHIEAAFNHIWGIEDHRSFGRKFGDYLSIMFVAPVLVIVSGSATVFITTQVTTIATRIGILGIFGPALFAMFKLIPYVLIWTLFTIVYMLMPNIRVRLFSGMTAGIVAGSLYQIAQWGYIIFQVNATRYNAIYGSFAALPLFLIWLQVSWFIVLLGAEISCAHQTVDAHETETDQEDLSPYLDRLIGLMVIHRIVGRFSKGSPPPNVDQLARSLQISGRLVRHALDRLEKSGMVSKICPASDDEDETFQPARDIHRLSVHTVIDALDRTGINQLPNIDEQEAIAGTLARFSDLLAASPENRLVKDL